MKDFDRLVSLVQDSLNKNDDAEWIVHRIINDIEQAVHNNILMYEGNWIYPDKLQDEMDAVLE